jgi:hypothetical protein
VNRTEEEERQWPFVACGRVAFEFKRTHRIDPQDCPKSVLIDIIAAFSGPRKVPVFVSSDLAPDDAFWVTKDGVQRIDGKGMRGVSYLSEGGDENDGTP